MRHKVRGILALAALASGPYCVGQSTWSVGAAGGFSSYHEATISNPTGVANAGFDSGYTVGGVLGEDVSNYFGGELRYLYLAGDSKLRFENGGPNELSGGSHALHLDFLAYATKRHSRFRPFAAAGAGIKRYVATGQPIPNQPLTNFATLAHRDQVEPLASFGGGIKAMINDHWVVRVDFRDYLTPFPENVIVPAPGAKLHGWLHDFVPLLGIDWTFGQ